MAAANQFLDTARNYYMTYVNEEIEKCTKEGLARSLHATQDCAARAHGHDKAWHGPKDTPWWDLVRHAASDVVPSNRRWEDAIRRGLKLIEEWSEKCGYPNTCSSY